MKKEFKLTKDGIEELKQELKSLNDSKPSIVEALQQARAQGDLAENADYDSARSELERTESKIKELENILANVEIIKNPTSNGAVKLGSSVELKSDKGTKTFAIVGSVEANPAEGKISDESPIGQAVLGKKVGDEVKIQIPNNGSTVYKVKAIS